MSELETCMGCIIQELMAEAVGEEEEEEELKGHMKSLDNGARETQLLNCLLL